MLGKLGRGFEILRHYSFEHSFEGSNGHSQLSADPNYRQLATSRGIVAAVSGESEIEPPGLGDGYGFPRLIRFARHTGLPSC